MKKTIAAVALLASAQAMAMPYFAEGTKHEKICLKVEKDGESTSVCDARYINKGKNIVIDEKTGCAKGQVVLYVHVLGEASINSCMPPGMAQL